MDILQKSNGGLVRPVEIYNAMATMATVSRLPLESVVSCCSG